MWVSLKNIAGIDEPRLNVSRRKDTLTMSLAKLCLLSQEQSSFKETEVEIDFHLMVGTLRFFFKSFYFDIDIYRKLQREYGEVLCNF